MDQFVTWVLSLTIVLGIVLAVFYEARASRRKPSKWEEWRVMMLALALLGVGTFVLSTLTLLGESGVAPSFFMGFNRAIFAGLAVYLAFRSHARWRGRGVR